ncbi:MULTISPECIES: entericidin A/B family lipoprotein [unclassified Roseovarius]|nr:MULTISPECIES: entericidin A/B family lipoprotein [unclassified Roseovarius]
MTRSRLSLISLLFMGVLAACETVEGAGRDIQGAGQAVTGASQDVQE